MVSLEKIIPLSKINLFSALSFPLPLPWLKTFWVFFDYHDRLLSGLPVTSLSSLHSALQISIKVSLHVCLPSTFSGLPLYARHQNCLVCPKAIFLASGWVIALCPWAISPHSSELLSSPLLPYPLCLPIYLPTPAAGMMSCPAVCWTVHLQWAVHFLLGGIHLNSASQQHPNFALENFIAPIMCSPGEEPSKWDVLSCQGWDPNQSNHMLSLHREIRAPTLRSGCTWWLGSEDKLSTLCSPLTTKPSRGLPRSFLHMAAWHHLLHCSSHSCAFLFALLYFLANVGVCGL